MDDDENAHVLLTRAFIKAGINVSIQNVPDGAQAVQYLLGQGDYSDRRCFPIPDLVLLDLQMPRRNGFDFLRFVSDRPELQAIPVVVFSSSDVPADVSLAYDLKCHSYVVKPSKFEPLVDLVKAMEKRFFSKTDRDETMFARFVLPAPRPTPEKGPRQMNETPLQASEPPPELFRLLIEQVKDYAIFTLDRSGKVLSWNEGARRIKGYEAREVIGQHFSIFYPQQDRDSQKPEFELAKAQDMGRYEEEGWRIRKDGSRFWANVIITPLKDDSGNLVGYGKVTRDLTQRKLQEESFQHLLDSEERFRLLVDQVKDYAIFILDARGNVSSWNQGARRLKGYSSDEILGKHFSIFYTPKDIQRDHPAQELTVAIRDGRYEEEGWRVRKDGTRFWANVIITSLWDKRGNLTGFAKVTRDLTQRKKEEDALRQKTEELESFAHTLSHDLRAPLRSISSFAQILVKEGNQLPEGDRLLYAQKIFKSSQLMEKLIRDILELSELTLSPFSEELVSLDEVLDECQTLLQGDIERSKAQIQIQSPMPRLKANGTLLVQLFSNLLSNAMKFMEPGKAPVINIYAVRKDDHCEIHVKDNGLGIPEELHESVFKVFDRGAANAQMAGTGIGLAVVKKVVERIGGKIELKSKVGEGSDFVLTLECTFPEPVAANAG